MTNTTLSFNDFKYKRYIVDLTEAEFTESRDYVLATWSGALELWAVLSTEVQIAKRAELMSLLCAWYLCDMFPLRVTGGMMSTAGMFIGGKRIRDVALQFREWGMPDTYDALATNQFGIKAAYMMRYAPEMMGVYG